MSGFSLQYSTYCTFPPETRHNPLHLFPTVPVFVFLKLFSVQFCTIRMQIFLCMTNLNIFINLHGELENHACSGIAYVNQVNQSIKTLIFMNSSKGTVEKPYSPQNTKQPRTVILYRNKNIYLQLLNKINKILKLVHDMSYSFLSISVALQLL